MMTQNEIIQTRRAAERFFASPLPRALRAAFMLLPRPVRRWVLTLAIKQVFKAMKRQGYVAADILAIAEEVNRQRKMQ